MGNNPIFFKMVCIQLYNFCICVVNISYVTTYRNQIMPEVQANGIDSVIDRLNSGQLQLAD